MTPEASGEPDPEQDPFGDIDDDEPLPPRQELHALGQLAVGVAVVVALIAAVLTAGAVLSWLFR